MTHFLCLPLVTPTSRPLLERSLYRFANELSALGKPVANADTSEQDLSTSNNGEEARPAAGAVATSPTHAASATTHHSPASAIDSRAVRPVGTLHLTLGVMSLTEPSKLAEASKLLTELATEEMLEHAAARRSTAAMGEGREQTPVSAPLRVDLRGLASMHAPSKTSVLYTTPCDATDRLLRFCEQLREAFVERGLLVKDDRPLKLHVTVVNTVYVKGRVGTGQGGGQKHAHLDRSTTADSSKEKSRRRRPGPVRFDARPVIEHFRDFMWAEGIVLDRLAICEMGAKKVVDGESGKVVDEAYKEVVSRALPV